MNNRDFRNASTYRHGQYLTLIVGAMLSILLGSTGGCQGRRELLSKPAQILLDSSLAGNEAFYDSATANLAMDRLSCLEDRARRLLGRDQVARIARKAEQTVRARHSRAEYAAGERGIEAAREIPDEIICKRIDSLWYATVVKQHQALPRRNE